MDGAAVIYLGTMAILMGVFGFLLLRAFRSGGKEETEAPKHRMMED